jgi:hypothetical protein
MTDGQVLLYQDEGGVRLQLRASDGTVWLSQTQIARLYATSVPYVLQMISRILSDGELTEATINSELIVRTEGGRQVQREIKVYNLDMVLVVGYRSTSPQAVRFRQWVTSVLRDYLVKGFAMDDQKLKAVDGSDFFEELLGRIRSIRASEKRFYQKVREMYATAIDYDPTSPTSQVFFATVQNKMLWAITGHTAAEIDKLRSDPSAMNMGLTSWSGSVVRKADVVTAKNYLASEEIHELDRIVTMFLDYAEDQAQRRQSMTMADWAGKLDAFLSLNERDLLTHAGRVQASVAQTLAEERFAEFDSARIHQAVVEEDRADLDSLLAIERKLEGGK